jgi:hypothetical protein
MRPLLKQDQVVRRDYGSSFNMLDSHRHIEAVDCYRLLDELHGSEAPWGLTVTHCHRWSQQTESTREVDHAVGVV